MRGSLQAELLKLRKRPATWVLLAVWLPLTVLFGYVIPYLVFQAGGSQETGGLPPEELLASTLPGELVPTTVSGFPLFGGAIALILGALSSGSEYGWATFKTVLTQRPRRLGVYGGKLAALAAAVLGVVLATFAVTTLSSWVVASIESAPLDWPPLLDWLKGIGSGWLIMGMWSLLGFLFGILFRGTALAIGLGLVWALVIENLVRGVSGLLDWLESVERWLPGANAGSLVAALGATGEAEGGGTPGVAPIVDGTQASIVLAIYTVAFAVIAVAVFQRRDVT